jgi:hypothetical protein
MEPITDAEKAQPEPLPVLPFRLVSVFVSPGRLVSQLAENPRWAGALLVVAAVACISVLLIPIDLFIEVNRQQALERGVDFPEMGENGIRAMRIVIPVMTVVSTVVFSFVFAGLYTLIFAFILGDEGRFTQYLAVVTHAWFIAVLFGLLVTPLRISTGDPQFTLNLASFMFFVPEGYFLNVFRVLDLTQIWSTLVIAQGVHAIDHRRSFASAATVLLTLLVLIALGVARFI